MTQPAIHQVVDVGRVSFTPAVTGWRVDYLRPDGVRWCHVFPDGTMGWRAAEYGIDLNDADTLLQTILHEQHIAVSPDDPAFLYNTDEETARIHHLAKVQASQKLTDYADPHGLLAQIRDHHRASIDLNEHARKVTAVRALRAQKMKEISRG